MEADHQTLLTHIATRWKIEVLFGDGQEELELGHYQLMSIALLHQKSYRAGCSTGGQEILVALSTGEIGAGDGPPITSSCHCSSKVSEAGELGSCASRAGGCGFARGESVQFF
jgi:hypothetical protein